ncbi:hypothetical protein JZ751_015105 [Albula glossodonta]|uniref:Uncharacterized protein n=1 Tax=Albula glossodonta TaxID=121402 RepID=A0A8T2NRN7_9TELE|nr:hypothetical protein JZ751_015105 [Albula glossodonta]
MTSAPGNVTQDSQHGERKRREEIRSKAKSIQLRLNGFNSESEDKDDDPCKAEAMAAQSYENVEAAVYFNREAVTYYVPAEEGDDYVTPDTEGCETEEGSGETQNDSLFPPQNLTDTDGESYENMESALYAKPRRRPAQDADTQEEEDYIDPDGGEKEKDGESYENMESSEYSQPRRHSNPDLPHCQRTAQEGTEEEEDDSYEKMASIAVPGTTERETDWEGGRAKARRDWYHTQKTV